MITTKEREMLLTFIGKHADGDILIQTANRVSNNLTDIEDLRKFIIGYKAPLHAGDFVSDAKVAAEDDNKPDISVIDHPEDLGPVPKKLGANGQSIERLMLRNPEIDYSVDGLNQALRISVAKIKPMLALLIERNRVVRASNYTYRIVVK